MESRQIILNVIIFITCTFLVSLALVLIFQKTETESPVKKRIVKKDLPEKKLKFNSLLQKAMKDDTNELLILTTTTKRMKKIEKFEISFDTIFNDDDAQKGPILEETGTLGDKIFREKTHLFQGKTKNDIKTRDDRVVVETKDGEIKIVYSLCYDSKKNKVGLSEYLEKKKKK